jgi:hypothetical protein
MHDIGTSTQGAVDKSSRHTHRLDLLDVPGPAPQAQRRIPPQQLGRHGPLLIGPIAHIRLHRRPAQMNYAVNQCRSLIIALM